MEKKQVEILAPAGSWGSLKAAVAAGADAVYMGGSRYGARAYADNPDEKGLLEAIDYAHLHGRRLYMTVNTLFKEEELKELGPYMRPYYEQGLDGVIVQDLGALSLMKELFPGLELHASTQMTITGAFGAKLLKQLGCGRIVASREMSLEEIGRMRRKADVEVESFVHGALCYCYSGQCLMSSLIGARSGNRGRCAQPCRLPYTVYQEDSRNRKAALNGESERYVLSLKDLCALDILPDIVEAGVYSLKIEGRMKSPRYTAGVVSIYRKYVDRYLESGRSGYYVEPEDRKMLLELFDRGGFTQGYYKQHNGREMTVLKEKPDFREGNQTLYEYLDKTYVEAEPKEEITGRARLRENEPSRLTLDWDGLNVMVEGEPPVKAINQPMSREKVLKQLGKTGGTPFVFSCLTADMEGSLFMPVQALNELRRKGLLALEEEKLRRRRREYQGRPEHGAAEDVFSNNTAKESAAGERKAAASDGKNRTMITQPGLTALGSLTNQMNRSVPVLTVSIEEPNQLPPALASQNTLALYLDMDGFGPERWKESADLCHEAGKACFLALPHIFRSQAGRLLDEHGALLQQAGFDGVLIRSLDEIQWLHEAGVQLPRFMDASVYAWNSRTVSVLKELGALGATMPWELNSRELRAVAKACGQAGIEGELIVYGRAPMMTSAQCITKTVKGCSRKRGILWMKDRTGAELPVKKHCSFCYNTIYNPLPLSLLGSEELIKRLGIGRLRLQFTTEEPGEEAKILDAFARSFICGEKIEEPFKDFTRGHFKRGVE